MCGQVFWSSRGINSFSARIFNEFNGTDSSLEHFREFLYSVKTPDIKKEKKSRYSEMKGGLRGRKVRNVCE